MRRILVSRIVARLIVIWLACSAGLSGEPFDDCTLAQAAEGDKPAADKRAAKPAVKYYPLKIAGQALDPDGNPIAGATVFLVSTNNSPNEKLGQAVTDRDGKYEFRDAKLPVTIPTDKEFHESGSFQVFGKAPGYGIAWCGMRFLYTDPRDQGANGGLARGPESIGYLLNDDIVLDLEFATPKILAGHFVDEKRKPIEGVKLRLSNCDYLITAGREKQKNFREFWAIGQAFEWMPDELQAVSDAEGRFEFKSIPAEMVCWLRLEHPDYGSKAFYTATSDDPPAVTDGDHQVMPLPIEMTLQRVRAVSVQLVSEKTDKPISGARIHAFVQRASGNWSGGTTDQQGKILLKLPPGEYRLTADPPRDSKDNVIRTSHDLTVDDTEVEQTVTVKLQTGCVVILKAIDSETEKGIPGVTFWYETPGFRGRRGVQSNTWYVDNPKTNDKGELRAVLAPGKFKFGIGFDRFPKGYKQDRAVASGTDLELKAEDEATVEFLLVKEVPAR